MPQEAPQAAPIRSVINELEGEYRLLEPAALDSAIVGLVAGFGDDEGVVCYDRDAVVDILMADGATREEAEGFFAIVMAGEEDDAAPRLITSTKVLMSAQNAASIRAAIDARDGTFLLLEPADMDAAIAGLVSAGAKAPVTCYDRDLVIEVLMKDGMDRDEAEEFFSFNIEGAYVGEATPMFLTSTKTLLDQSDLGD